MPRLFDRRTGRHLGTLSADECRQIMALFAEPEHDEVPDAIDPERLQRLEDAGASRRLLEVVEQIMQDPEDFDLDWEPD